MATFNQAFYGAGRVAKPEVMLRTWARACRRQRATRLEACAAVGAEAEVEETCWQDKGVLGDQAGGCASVQAENPLGRELGECWRCDELEECLGKAEALALQLARANQATQPFARCQARVTQRPS